MVLKKSITYSVFIASSILVSSCGDKSGDGNSASSSDDSLASAAVQSFGQSSRVGFKISSLADNLEFMVLTYNGFSGKSSQYTGSPSTAAQNLVKDLSATNLANLYFFSLYVNTVGTREKPATGTPINYPLTLSSGIKIYTGLTLLSPEVAMNSTQPGIASFKDRVTPSVKNPVILTVPAGKKAAPETPFFPIGSRYTAVLAEAQPSEDSHSAILSIESSPMNPVIFGAFAHTVGSPLRLRFYDSASTIETPLGDQLPVLSQPSVPGIIKARFLSLVASSLPKMSLYSMDNTTFGELGLTSGRLLSLLHGAFPSLVDEETQGSETTVYPIFNPDHGIFCLGGNNNFDTVNLDHQTFVYPMSYDAKVIRPATTGAVITTIDTVNVSADSGFITESGRHINVNTLNGNGTLKLITVMKDAAVDSPIVQVKDLKGVNKVNVVVGKVADKFVIPTTGVILLSYDNKDAVVTTATEDAHMGGVLYDGETKVEDGKIILTQLIKKPAALGSGTIHQLLARHPETQGISGRALTRLTASLDPIARVDYQVGGLSSAHMNHSANLQLHVPSSTQVIMPVANHLTFSASNRLNHTVVSSNFNYQRTHGLGLAASLYGVINDKREAAFGSTLTGFKQIIMPQGVITPSISVGYTSNSLKNIDLSSEKIQVGLHDVVLNSFFARILTTVKHTHDKLTASFSAGLEARYGIFAQGKAISNHTKVSVEGDSQDAFHSILEASFTTEAVQVKTVLWNFNQVELSFWISR
jgi:hypothetical protein